jgi:hypothetical protein
MDIFSVIDFARNLFVYTLGIFFCGQFDCTEAFLDALRACS